MIVNDIFYSIQGESTYAGLPCIFVRLTGCNLRCRYCDTQYAYFNGFEASADEIEQKIRKYNCNLIEITGGEPLIQSETPELAQRLVQRGFQVLVETNGSLDIDVLPYPIIRIMDFKCPGSGELDKMNWSNLKELRSQDEVKFVISDQNVFKWAMEVVERFNLLNRSTVLLSPVHGVLQPQILSQWLLKEKLSARIQIQLQKYLSIK